jgi:hypothetical protein
MKPARHPAASQRRCAAVRRRRRFRPPLNRELTRAYPRRAVLEAVCRRQRDRRRARGSLPSLRRPRPEDDRVIELDSYNDNRGARAA